MDYQPPYWGTKKGKILKAIAIDWCFYFREVQGATGIEARKLNGLIDELMAEDLIYVFNGQYRVKKDMYYEYWDYAVHFTDLPKRINEEYLEIVETSRTLHAREETQSKNVVEWVNTWVKFQKNYDIEIIMKNYHFYLDGNLLPNFIHDVVRRANRNITYVTPWVEEIGVTKNLMSASKDGKEVIVVTREPDWSSKSDWGKRQAKVYEKCHSNLSKSGATVCYNNEIHGKVLLIDNQIAIVSSFNLLKNPASGLSWEAGIITYEPEIVQSIKDSINNFIVK